MAVPLGHFWVSTFYLKVQLSEVEHLPSVLWHVVWHAWTAPWATASTANPCHSSYTFPVEHTQTIWAESSAWQYVGNSSVHGTKHSSAMGLPHGRSPLFHSSLALEICFGLVGGFLKMKFRQVGQWLRQTGYNSYSCSMQLLHNCSYGIKKAPSVYICFGFFYSSCPELIFKLTDLK